MMAACIACDALVDDGETIVVELPDGVLTQHVLCPACAGIARDLGVGEPRWLRLLLAVAIGWLVLGAVLGLVYGGEP